ncbi:5-formyltetrahydrofolate cyclo-ligase [Phycicoccus flavus]|uniref:5-formyltetrahydrofolate cyclo-ligase n=1 Tax=Phycicoccus flavus TaxID=2502783 RepID=UPI001F466F57|nr:5-formyltetrahydrofolate cyclo-ligase [Phycicoccus flavus]
MTDSAKRGVRSGLRARRRGLAAARDLGPDGADARALATRALALVDGLDLTRPAVVLSYASVPGEPPTTALNAALVAAGHRVLVPITLPGLDLDWHDVTAGPDRPLGRDAPGLADLVLAPGLAADGRGTRLGQGGGCYDRALPRRRPGTPVVLVLHPGELDTGATLPREEHDEPVDAVLTADGVVRLR